MYTIQANPSGTRSLEVSEENLATIEKYYFPPSHRQQRYCGRNRARQVETEHPLPHRRARGRQQRPARPLYRRYLSQQHEGLRTTTAHQALSAMAFPTRHHRRRINENHRHLRTTALQPFNPCHQSHVRSRKRRSWKSSWTTLLPSMT